jgi:uncharacterized protein YfaP (DUF2135 family)
MSMLRMTKRRCCATVAAFPLGVLMMISAGMPQKVLAQVELAQPQGGWRADVGRSGGFMQEVNYPASRVNLHEGTSASAQIRGQIQKARKPNDVSRPAKLVVNGVPMPIETDENGQFARPYAFGAGSNSVEVRSADGKHSRRVQFIDHGQASRARLRVVLNWDSPGTDMDLHVISPSGQHCFYGNRIIGGGGALDVDVTTGYGPEIFAASNPERGTWHVYVNYFGGGESASLTTAQVSIVTNEGTLQETQRVQRIPLRATGDLQQVLSFAVL